MHRRRIDDGSGVVSARVLHISSSLSRSAGGLYHSVSGLAKAQLAQGADVVVLGGADGHFTEDRHVWGEVPLRHFPQRGVYAFHPAAIAHLLSSRPDLVHLHGVWTATSLYGRMLSAVGIPIVLSPRGMLNPWIVGRRRTIKQVHAALFERALLRNAHVHALNEAERAAIGQFAPLADDRIFVQPNGIDREEIRPSGGRRTGTLYLGRLHPTKQVLELARTWARSPRLRGACLTIAGWGDAAYERELRGVAYSASNIEFVGPLYGAAKDEALAKARALVLPSRSEGQPMVVLEALRAGCLPVITDACNYPDLIQQGAAVRMKQDFSDLEPIIEGICAEPDEVVTERSRCLTAHAEQYRWDPIARAMLDKYEAILNAHRRRDHAGAPVVSAR